jgi:hypothetical protein
MSIGSIDMMLQNIMSGFFIWLGIDYVAFYAAIGIVNINAGFIKRVRKNDRSE